MAMMTILCLRQGRYDPMEAHCRRVDVTISTADLKKCNTTNLIELSKAYVDGENEDGTKRFQEMCLIMFAELD